MKEDLKVDGEVQICRANYDFRHGPITSFIIKTFPFCMHCPVSLLRASPTTIGRTSSGDPSSFLIKAVSEPPARYLATSAGALPLARMLTTALSEAQMGVARWTSAASMRCCICRPEGLLAQFLGN